MDAKLNQGTWKIMESKWPDNLNRNLPPPKSVYVDISATFKGDSK